MYLAEVFKVEMCQSQTDERCNTVERTPIWNIGGLEIIHPLDRIPLWPRIRNQSTGRQAGYLIDILIAPSQFSGGVALRSEI